MGGGSIIKAVFELPFLWLAGGADQGRQGLKIVGPEGVVESLQADILAHLTVLQAPGNTAGKI